ncbi:UNVERIFIED_CONTAM: hypothetical protein Cloal_2826 [Acetivibrio alkalicellulosi]
MNKRRVNDLIPKAYEVLSITGIAKNGTIQKTFRGQIATFGAAISMGSLLSAIAFFSNDGDASVERSKLIKAIHILIDPNSNNKDLFEFTKSKIKNGQENIAKEEVINGAIALKLAMNFYHFNKTSPKSLNNDGGVFDDQQP